MNDSDNYSGFEIGPIRPPSEAHSLLLRITRNCPWNKCTFCSLYKGEKFSIRPVAEIRRDIDLVRHYVDAIERLRQETGSATQMQCQSLLVGRPADEQMALHIARLWIQGGMESIFLQDANTLVIRPDDLVEILEYARTVFPSVKRITSYARSHTVARISDSDLQRLATAGLNRIHIGMESACDAVLDFVRKGADKETHIKAGQKVRRAGIELSEYFMPGLGGAEFSRQNALETAAALNRIDPDFIRIRTLGLPESIELFDDYKSGAFARLGDVAMAEELLLMLEKLDGITSTVKSDHILNLLQEVEGTLPEDKEKMTAPLRRFLALAEDEQLLYMVGRRSGIFSRLDDLHDAELRRHAENCRSAHRVTRQNIDEFTLEMMQRFI
ncbi:MAG: radical SAM protein [Desulfuromonas sp.]|nr:MAG: radical SAM protein [Desulfuromonas sp.]